MGLERVCRSTHSDFLAVADPELLIPVVQALRKKVPAAGKWRDGTDLGTLLDDVVAYGGSYFDVPVSVARAMQMHMSHPAPAAATSPDRKITPIGASRTRNCRTPLRCQAKGHGFGLPDIEIYLPKLASLHFTAIEAVGKRPKFLEDYTDIFREDLAGLLAIGEAGFLAKYREVILPQAQIARNQGFPADWKFRGQP